MDQAVCSRSWDGGREGRLCRLGAGLQRERRDRRYLPRGHDAPLRLAGSAPTHRMWVLPPGTRPHTTLRPYTIKILNPHNLEGFAPSIASKRRVNNLKGVEDFYLGQHNLTLTVLHVPYSLDSGPSNSPPPSGLGGVRLIWNP